MDVPRPLMVADQTIDGGQREGEPPVPELSAPVGHEGKMGLHEGESLHLGMWRRAGWEHLLSRTRERR